MDNPVGEIGRQFRGTAPAYDGITEVWWDSAEDLAEALQTPEGREANKTLLQDEARFCEMAESSIFLTTEHEIFDFRESGYPAVKEEVASELSAGESEAQ